MAEIKLEAKKRVRSTKGDLNKIRKEGFIPGTFYARGEDPLSIYVTAGGLNPLVYTSETHMVDLKVDDEKETKKAILKATQFDPVTDKVVHFDLLGVTMGQRLQLQVPVVLTGSAVGIKNGGVLQQSVHKLDVECFPRHIPEHISIDITGMDVNDSVHVSDLDYEDLDILNHEDTMIVSIAIPTGLAEEEEEGEELEEEDVEPEVIGKGKEEEENEEE